MLRKDHNRRHPISNYSQKDGDLIIDIDGDGNGDYAKDHVPKKKATSRVGVSSKKDLVDLGSIGEVTVMKI
jgi:hypothetical protein